MTPLVHTFVNSFNNKLEDPVRTHLKNVYACLTASTLSAAAGSAVHMYTDYLQAGFLTSIGALICFGLLMMTADEQGKNMLQRLGYLLGFAFLSGIGLGPLLEQVMYVNPNIIVTAFIGTTVVFMSFSICSMLAERGKYLYLGGTLMTILNSMVLLSLANLFFGSQWLFQVHLYLGLIMMCGFVLYDTQLIIEKRRQGSRDFVTHSLDLFIDFVGIFRRLVIILTQKEEESNKRRRN
ncbi:PREDICTED: bax inhibitor 1 [Nicrophorus vespilloides]|uniref:Bax inhibitor 1 n=1 Tax=Nicrophorus vespilloides TaxID=110193 RepID=A0ABM1MFL8_NICVS|nr:PREDICTED: bax inhibitor 1 [Nicrophorus vespilloides]